MSESAERRLLREARKFVAHDERMFQSYEAHKCLTMIDALLAQPERPSSSNSESNAAMSVHNRDKPGTLGHVKTTPGVTDSAAEQRPSEKNDEAPSCRPAKEQGTADLIHLYGEIAGRLALHDTKEMHDRYHEIRGELLNRFAASATQRRLTHDIHAVHQFLGPDSGLTHRDVSAVLDAAEKVQP